MGLIPWEADFARFGCWESEGRIGRFKGAGNRDPILPKPTHKAISESADVTGYRSVVT